MTGYGGRRRGRGLWAPAVVGMVCLSGAAAGAGVPAFPGAEGFGVDTPGGRGGRVIKVTSLADRGPGSLRAACEAEGPRIIVFDTGGTITLERNIEVRHPFATIAGQTAPDGGVTLRGGGLKILTHDVVIRHVRFRMGRLPQERIEGFQDGIHIAGRPSPHHVVLDHCSISWGTSRNLVTWGDAHDITVQWCVISEAIRSDDHTNRAYEGMGFLVGDRTRRISVHHCLFAHNYQRNPRLKHGVEGDFVNNVVYDWGGQAASGCVLIGDFERRADAPPVRVNLVGNWFASGRETPEGLTVLQLLTPATLYLAGNVADRPLLAAALRESMRRLTLSARPLPAPPVTTWAADEALRRVLAEAGATRPMRDAVDARVVAEVRNGTGGHIGSEGDVGGWPDLAHGTPWADRDGDGMPDAWERNHLLDPGEAADANRDKNGNGYTNIEEWLNERAAAPRAPATAAGVAARDGAGDAVQTAPAKVYGVGILGNCCTHGAGVAGMFMRRRDTRVVAGYEKDARRGAELAQRIGMPLAESYQAVVAHPDVDIVAVTCDPCDKASMVEMAAAAGKAIFLNKPFCESLNSARRIAAAVKRHDVPLVHDIPMVRFVPVYARLLREVRAGTYGRVMGYHHLFGMNFAPDFDLAAVWPERLDPAAKSGGGEMTNMGCYAIDFAVSLFGRPKAVTAKWRKTWDVYREADVENFGQIVLEYGDFFAFLEVGKQPLAGARRHANRMTINFEHTTLGIDASAQQVTINHVPQDWGRFAAGATATGAVEQLIAAIEKGTPPTSDAETGVVATEVLMAAYRSIVEGRTVSLPLESGANPLVGR
jgi:pectate lyase